MSKTFPMTKISGPCAEFQARFQKAYEIAHSKFRAAVRGKKDFVVTQRDVLNAQVVVEAAHRSAGNGGIEYVVARSENLDQYAQWCWENKLL